jgi:phage gpG-like protein
MFFVGDSDETVFRFFTQSTPRILASIEPALMLAMADLKTYIQSNKLEGQALKSHTHALSGSLNIRVESDGDISISGYVGTNIIYARIHEYGYSGAETVNEYTQIRTKVFGRTVPSYTVAVREHERMMEMPARPYMIPSLEENREAIMRRIREAIEEAIRAA